MNACHFMRLGMRSVMGYEINTGSLYDIAGLRHVTN